MTTQNKLFKGESMEEKLRNYFLSKGYFVVRSIFFKYANHTITDIDLYLYQKSSAFTRVRINVDIKNKKTPQAIERIFWTIGLQKILSMDKCIVATTDKRNEVKDFGESNNVLVLDGIFLSKLKFDTNQDRLIEEDLINLFRKIQTRTYNGDWRLIYNRSKTRIINKIGFSSLNESLKDIKYLIEKIITDPKKSTIATRLLYITISHFIIMIDYILYSIYHLPQNERLKRIDEGFKFGDLGKKGIEQTIQLAMALNQGNNKEKYDLLDKFGQLPTKILSEYFSNSQFAEHAFDLALKFENEGFLKDINMPVNLTADLKSIIGVILDYFSFRRNDLFQ